MQPSGWTTDTLRAHLIMRIDYEAQLAAERDRRYAERWSAQEAATAYALEKSNEFRGALGDLSTTMATKAELSAVKAAVEATADVQANLLAEIRSRLDVGNPAVTALQQQAAANAGITQGSQLSKANFYAALAAVGTILAIVVLLSNGVFK